MANTTKRSTIADTVVRFVSPVKLRNELQELANERSITLSALLRLIATDYIRRSKSA